MKNTGKKGATDLIKLACGLIILFLLHWIMLQMAWYSSLPNLAWDDEYGVQNSVHSGLIGIILLALTIGVASEEVARRFRSKECPRCGVSRAIKKSTILLSTEEKEGLFKTSPQLFSEIGLELRSAIESRVTATYVQCKNCGNQLECSLKTDAHITDDYRE